MCGVRKDLKIVIIGGGIAGLALGIGLKNHGFTKVTIYERDDGFERRQQGYGLTMLQGINALKKLGHGIYEKVKDLDTPSRSHYIFDCHGNIICFFGTLFYPQSSSTLSTKSKKHNLHISRQNLRNILLHAYCALEKKEDSSGSLRWNQKLMNLTSVSSSSSSASLKGSDNKGP